MISKLMAVIMALVSLISGFGADLPQKTEICYDVAYGTSERQVIDVTFPKKYAKKRGVVLFIHGGAWIGGTKDDFKKRLTGLSDKWGCITVSMNYRYVSDELDCSDVLDDIDDALKKVKSMAKTRGITTTKVMLTGYSAGAHLAMLYAYTRKNTAPIKPGAVASFSGPVNLAGYEFVMENSLSGPEYMLRLMSYLTGEQITAENFKSKKKVLLKYSPTNYVSSACVPTIILQGKKDDIVPPVDTRNFVEKLKSKGVTYEYYELPNSAHSLKSDPKVYAKGAKAFVEYLDKYIK